MGISDEKAEDSVTNDSVIGVSVYIARDSANTISASESSDASGGRSLCSNNGKSIIESRITE